MFVLKRVYMAVAALTAQRRVTGGGVERRDRPLQTTIVSGSVVRGGGVI